MYVLGIGCYYHDSSACLLKDGAVVAAAEEERFTRKKHDTSFPFNAIQYCLKSQEITINEIDYVGFYEKPFLKFERLLSQHIEMFPRSFKTFITSTPSWINQKLRVVKTLRKQLKYKGDILFVEHHMAHAASCFLVSPFDRAAILTVDGVGEWTTTSYGIGEGNTIALQKEIRFPHSIGLLYSTITAYLGMSVNNSEYKCLHPSTEVLFSNGSTTSIETLFNLPGIIKRISPTEDILQLKSPIELISLDKSTLKLLPHKTKTVYRKKANTHLYEVELKSGRKVTVTPNHKFTTVNLSAEVHSIQASNLVKNDFVMIPRRYGTKPLSAKYKKWVKLLAYSIAEGHELVRKAKHEAEIRIGTSSPELSDAIKKAAQEAGKTYRVWKASGKENMHHVGISVWKDLPTLARMGHTFGKRAAAKDVPQYVMQSDCAVKKEFLSALFDCDGGFVGHQIIYSTKSEILASQVVYLLLNFGVHARLRKVLNKKYNLYYFRVEINGKDLKTFYDRIGFTLKEKQHKLHTYLTKIEHFGNNVDVIPINDYVLQKWISAGHTKLRLYKTIKYHFWDYETKKRYPTARMLERIQDRRKDTIIKKFIESDIYFDQVKSVRKVAFKGYVYDVLMPQHHTFVGGRGGIVLHNTMGLAAYGDMTPKNKYYKRLRRVMDIKVDGSFAMDMSYFVYHYKDRMPSQKLCDLLEGPVRKPESEMTRRHKDIAAALQMITEDVLTKILHHVHKETKQENIVIAGGVGLNSVFNGKILIKTPFKRVWIQPAAGDGGTSLGAAFFVYNAILGKERSYQMKDAYLGPGYSTDFIRRFLDENSINHSEFKDEKALIKAAAELILKNQVIGWFQGRMEWGPRALGSRSILSNPLNPKMRDILNLKVKHREKFRPFAPVVCRDDSLTYFSCDNPVPEPTDYMLMVYPVRKKWRKKLPSVTHVDGSGRLQTVRRFQNPLYYDLIKEFGRHTGIPILINTSFNIRGEPIVCTPYDAYRCMMGTGIDCLVMGGFLIRRKDNQSDIWDSEKLASD